jgi:hypothetical protein
VEAFSDRELVANVYVKTLKTLQEGAAPVLVVEYHKIRKQFSEISSLGVAQLEFHINQTYNEKLEGLCNISKFANFVLNEQLLKFTFEMSKMAHATLDVTMELRHTDGEITGGCFMPDGGILLLVADAEQNKILNFNKAGKCVNQWNTSICPNDVTLDYFQSNILFISCSQPFVEGMHRFKIVGDAIRKLPPDYCCNSCRNEECFGIINAYGYLYVVCRNSILKMNDCGSIIKRYATERGIYSVAVDKNKRIIYSSCSSHRVTCLNDAGSPLFHYTHPDLQYPYSLDVDFEGYIYVAGRNSNNIHILSPSGKLLNILEFSKPNYIKFKEDSRICLIGSDKSSCTKICKIKVPNSPY